ncbi:hypothetical protein [Streptomyces sp. NPDC093598]|uniref:hypothetical protein n=1 Tax=Streptomyces sp. NPDC093598 TaxID=3366046 RepID=UPI00382D231F
MAVEVRAKDFASPVILRLLSADLVSSAPTRMPNAAPARRPHSAPTEPGAIGAFRRDAVLGVGGVSEDTLAEDTE